MEEIKSFFFIYFPTFYIVCWRKLSGEGTKWWVSAVKRVIYRSWLIWIIMERWSAIRISSLSEWYRFLTFFSFHWLVSLRLCQRNKYFHDFNVVVTTSICYVALDSLVRLVLNKVRSGLKYPGWETILFALNLDSRLGLKWLLFSLAAGNACYISFWFSSNAFTWRRK